MKKRVRKCSSNMRDGPHRPSRCLAHSPVNSMRVAQVWHNRAGVHVEDTELVQLVLRLLKLCVWAQSRNSESFNPNVFKVLEG
jgi:hypothetical protein